MYLLTHRERDRADSLPRRVISPPSEGSERCFGNSEPHALAAASGSLSMRAARERARTISSSIIISLPPLSEKTAPSKRSAQGRLKGLDTFKTESPKLLVFFRAEAFTALSGISAGKGVAMSSWRRERAAHPWSRTACARTLRRG